MVLFFKLFGTDMNAEDITAEWKDDIQHNAGISTAKSNTVTDCLQEGHEVSVKVFDHQHLLNNTLSGESSGGLKELVVR